MIFSEFLLNYSHIFQTIEEKECEWARKNEALRRDLRHAIRSSIQDTEREAASLDSLEQVLL